MTVSRMVSQEAPGVTGPTTPHLLCAHSKMSWAFKPLSDFGIPSDLLRTVMWLHSSAVELKHGRISMMATMGDLDALLIHVCEDATEDKTKNATNTFPKTGPNFKHRTT